ncbi:FliI/YscN family ATPase [Nitrospira defluvii]|nr:FliI/YscN family ATPase [Nitrospira defluvii]
MSVSVNETLRHIEEVDPLPAQGKLLQAIGLVLEGYAPSASIGEVCTISSTNTDRQLLAEVVGFRDKKILLMPLGDLRGIGPGAPIVSRGDQATAYVGEELLGRVIDGLGHPLDDLGPLNTSETCPIYVSPQNPLSRKRIKEPLDLGIRAINALLTCGKGQRVGILAATGVGKSVLLGMIARYTSADVNVIALIGERGREVKEFIEKELKEDGLRRSVVIVATSEQPPLIRRRAAFLAITIAEYFREKNKQVLFLMDSLTRLAHAQREIGLAIGEPPTTKGYTPSVFATLPKFLERAGTSSGQGTITGLYTVLVEGDDLNDPIADAARSILDGHIVLSRTLAAENHYPAIDILNSTSRVMVDIVDPKQVATAQSLIELMATYRKAEDLINIGAYKTGSNQKIDKSIAMHDAIEFYLRQDTSTKADLKESVDALSLLFASLPEQQIEDRSSGKWPTIDPA